MLRSRFPFITTTPSSLFISIRRNSSSSSSINAGFFAEKNKNLKLALADLESVVGTSSSSAPAAEKQQQQKVPPAAPQLPPKQNNKNKLRSPTLLQQQQDEKFHVSRKEKQYQETDDADHDGEGTEEGSEELVMMSKQEKILNKKIAGHEGEPIINKKEKLVERVLTDHLYQNSVIYRSSEIVNKKPQSNIRNTWTSEELAKQNAKLQAYVVDSVAWDATATVDDYRNLVRILISLSKKEVWETVQKQIDMNNEAVRRQLHDVDIKLKEYRALREDIRVLLREFKSLSGDLPTNTTTTEAAAAAAAEPKQQEEKKPKSNEQQQQQQQDHLPDFKLVANYNSVLELPLLKGKNIHEIPEDSRIKEISWVTGEEEEDELSGDKK